MIREHLASAPPEYCSACEGVGHARSARIKYLVNGRRQPFRTPIVTRKRLLFAGGGPGESGNGAPSEELKGGRNDSFFFQAESPSKPHFHCARSAHRQNRVIAAIDWIGGRRLTDRP